MLSRLLALGGVFAALSSLANETAGNYPEPGKWFLSPLASWTNSPDEYDVGDAVTTGLGLGVGFTDTVAAELTYMLYSPNRESAGSAQVTGLVALPTERAGLRPYLLGGIGRTSYEPHDAPAADKVQVFGGIGTFGDLAPRWSWRGDVRLVKTSGGRGVQPQLQAGLTLFFGKPSAGSVRDSDGDGVADARDDCPGTPVGAIVDDNGCELVDSDGDGVPDRDDKCPGTPPGVAVDSDGCPLDSDGDGVPDYLDECPGTPAGVEVDEVGCPIPLPEFPQTTLEFDFDVHELRPEHEEPLEQIGDFLKAHPDKGALIEGHADSMGSVRYNQRLSERRAGSVRERIEKSGVDADRLTTRGYGESRPKADNDTDEGRQRNRRVTVTEEQGSAGDGN